MPDDEPADEIPDFDIALEAEVSLDRIPDDMVDSIIKETPNARIEGDKLKMRYKKPLPTWKDLGLNSARTWKSSKPSIKENLIGVADAKKRLKEGFEVDAPDGGKVTFNEDVLRHWEETVKRESDVSGRLARLNIAQDCVRETLEVLELPNGQRTYLNIFESIGGKVKGIAVAVSNGTVVRTWFISKVQELNKRRKGKRINNAKN